MKNLLNCHSVGLHSFPISLKDGLYIEVGDDIKEKYIGKYLNQII